MTQPGIEPQSPGPLVNTLLIRSMDCQRPMAHHLKYNRLIELIMNNKTKKLHFISH